jgi:hypothetical protein
LREFRPNSPARRILLREGHDNGVCGIIAKRGSDADPSGFISQAAHALSLVVESIWRSFRIGAPESDSPCSSSNII